MTWTFPLDGACQPDYVSSTPTCHAYSPSCHVQHACYNGAFSGSSQCEFCLLNSHLAVQSLFLSSYLAECLCLQEMAYILSLAVVLACLQLSSATCTDLPIRLPGRVVPPSSDDSNKPTCPSDQERQTVLDQLDADLDQIVQAQLQVFQSLSSPVECPGDGWIRISDFNLENNIEDPCPGGWNRYNTNGIHHCGRPSGEQCQSANFSTNSVRYSQVCGRLKGYQYGQTSAFFQSTNTPDIDSSYLDGISITRGTPREHVWSFAAGYSAGAGSGALFRCPCVDGSTAPPDFVGNSYFCDSGTDIIPRPGEFYGSNPLWDAQACLAGNQCCSRGPYFFAELTQATCDPLEVRLCLYDSIINVGISIIELYVK